MSRMVRVSMIGVAMIGIAITCAALGTRAEAKAGPGADATHAQRAGAESGPRVTLAPVKQTSIAARSEVTGALQPAKALQFGFEVGGRLEEIVAKKGARVAPGQVIAKLDPEIADAQVAQADAAVKAAEASAAVAADAASRTGELRKTNNVSEQQAAAAQNQSAEAQAQVLAAKAQLAQAKAARKRHELRAPFAGVLVDAPDQVGAIVAPGVSLFTLEQLDPLSLRTTIAESERPMLALGAKVRVESAAGGVASDEATVSAIIPSADPQTRRVPIEISVPNKSGKFVAHTLARAVLPLGAEEPAQAVAASALAQVGGDHLFVVTESGATRRVPITVLERGAKQIVFRAEETLTEVIDFPAVDLDSGMKVSVR